MKIAEYAAREGISPQAANKRIRRTGVKRAADGTIDLEELQQQWHRIRREVRGDRSPIPFLPAVSVPTNGHDTRAEAQRIREWTRAKREELELRRAEGSLVDAAQISAATEARFRADAEALLNWPARIAADMAADLGIEERILHSVLDKYVRMFMQERSMVPLSAVGTR